MIRSGLVEVNGTIRREPETPVRMEHDRIAVNGRLVEPPAKIYLLMNKPRGAVTTASDEKGRETVYSVLASSWADLPAWVAPVGRLDKACCYSPMIPSGVRASPLLRRIWKKPIACRSQPLPTKHSCRRSSAACAMRAGRSCARSGHDCYAPGRRTAGWRSFWTKARIVKFAA